MASLWAVDDSATQSLVENFYERLLAPSPLLSKAQALRAAQLAVKANPKWQHPQYWAPFTIIGNWLAPEQRVEIYREIAAEKQ